MSFLRKFVFQPFLFWVFLGLAVAGLVLPNNPSPTTVECR